MTKVLGKGLGALIRNYNSSVESEEFNAKLSIEKILFSETGGFILETKNENITKYLLKLKTPPRILLIIPKEANFTTRHGATICIYNIFHSNIYFIYFWFT